MWECAGANVTMKGASDIPTLSHILATAEDILNALPSSSTSSDTERAKRSRLNVGCVGPLMREFPSFNPLHRYILFGRDRS